MPSDRDPPIDASEPALDLPLSSYPELPISSCLDPGKAPCSTRVLATFVHALPRAYELVNAPVGTTVRLTIEGDSGGIWYLTREGNVWTLRVEADRESVKPSACLTIDQDDAWKLFTKTITPGRIQPRVRIGGSRELAFNALSTVSIIA